MSNNLLYERIKSNLGGIFFSLNSARGLESFILGMYLSEKVNFKNVETYRVYSGFDQYVQSKVGIKSISWGGLIDSVYNEPLIVAKEFIFVQEQLNSDSKAWQGNYFYDVNLLLSDVSSFKELLRNVCSNLNTFKISNSQQIGYLYSGYLFALTTFTVIEKGVRNLSFNTNDVTFVNFYFPEFENFLVKRNNIANGGRYIDIISYLGLSEIKTVANLLYDNYIAFLQFKGIEPSE